MLLSDLIKQYQQQVNQALEAQLSDSKLLAQQLQHAMHYSVFNGGKRVRPLLVYLTGSALGIEPEKQNAPACAVEFIHCYSLVHDDMPSMDDDDLRRGKATCHKQFSEATALLTGDALQSLAFSSLCDNPYSPTKEKLLMVQTLAQASGILGMAGGQAIDLAATGQALSLPELKAMHEHKTGALIRASVKLGALCSTSITKKQLDALDNYAQHIGLSFQIKDDILDIEADTQTLGKPQGADVDLNKATYPSLLGLDNAKKMALQCHQNALNSLSGFNHLADPLRDLSQYIITRDH